MLPACQESFAVYNVYRLRQFVFLVSTKYMKMSTKRWRNGIQPELYRRSSDRAVNTLHVGCKTNESIRYKVK
jgi:hypothetical protein